MKMQNKMRMEFLSLPQNEGFARTVISAFCLEANPTIEELSDIKTAVSEAVTNCVVHAYEKSVGLVHLSAQIDGSALLIEVADSGQGIDDIERAREPFFTSKPESERSGMGFTVMESFMDDVEVIKNTPNGTIVRMVKKLACTKAIAVEESNNALSRRNS